MTYNSPDFRPAIPRHQLEELVGYLADKYPQTFFRSATLKRPLKKNIILDLEKEHTLDDQKREAALGFYQKDFNYENTLQAGAKRLDLTGKEVGTVTPQEQEEAQARVRAGVQRVREKRAEQAKLIGRPVEIVRKLHDEGRISTDMLSKINAVPLSNLIPQAQPDYSNGRTHDEQPWPVAPKNVDLKRLRTLWASIDGLLLQTNGDNAALVAAVLKHFVGETEKVVAALEKSET